MTRLRVGDLVRFVRSSIATKRLPYPHSAETDGIGIVVEIARYSNDRKYNYHIRWADHPGLNYGYYREELKFIF
jgi:hypothetical protein